MKKNVKRIIGLAAAFTLVLMIAGLSGTVKQINKVDKGTLVSGKLARLYDDFSSHVKAGKVSRENAKAFFPERARVMEKSNLEVIDSNGNVGKYCSIAVDSNGCPHISYYDATQKCLKYARLIGNRWVIKIVDTKVPVAADTSIAVDSDGWPHISYYDAARNRLKYARSMGAVWDIQMVDTKGDVGKHASIAVDRFGQPNIKYFDDTSRTSKCAQRTGGIWIAENKGISELMPLNDRNASSALDGKGVTHYVYYDEVAGDLVYTKGTQGPPQIPQINEISKPITTLGGVGGNTTNFVNEAMVTCSYDLDLRKELVIDFGPGYGIWVYENNTTWRLLSPLTAKSMAVGNIDADPAGLDDIVIDFGQYWGIWIFWNNSNWTQILTLTSNQIIAKNFMFVTNVPADELIADLGTRWGMYEYRAGTGWFLFTGQSPKLWAAGNITGSTTTNVQQDMVCDFGAGYGIWASGNNGASWFAINNLTCNGIAIGNWNLIGLDDIFIDYGPGWGIYYRTDLAGYLALNILTTECMTIGYLNGATYKSLICSFGQMKETSDPLLIEFMNYSPSSWRLLSSIFLPKIMLCADLDHTPSPALLKEELIGDFGTYFGIWILYNGTTWTPLNSLTTQ